MRCTTSLVATLRWLIRRRRRIIHRQARIRSLFTVTVGGGSAAVDLAVAPEPAPARPSPRDRWILPVEPRSHPLEPFPDLDARGGGVDRQGDATRQRGSVAPAAPFRGGRPTSSNGLRTTIVSGHAAGGCR